MPDAMPDSLTEYEMDREERLAKNRAVLAALSIPSLAAETREAADETADGSRRRGRAGASASTAPSRRSSRAEARKVKSYADAPGEDSGDRASDESDAGSDSARARAEEAADADFSGSDAESLSSGSETGGSEDEDEDEEDARVVRARVETPEIVELDEDGEELGGDAKGRGRKRRQTARARGAKKMFASNVSRDASNDDDASRPSSTRPNACPVLNPARKGRVADRERDARDGETKPKPKPKPKPKRGERRAEDEDEDEDEDEKKKAARDAFLAFLAPSASVAVRRGFLNLQDATFGLRELRVVVNAHGFEDWTDEELAQMLAPELVKPLFVPTTNASGESERADAAAETDPSAADARRRAVVAAAAAEMRLGVSDLERLAETVGARRRAT
jgi:hypothetical protein